VQFAYNPSKTNVIYWKILKGFRSWLCFMYWRSFRFRIIGTKSWTLKMPKCERRLAASHMSTILLSKAALELLSSRFEHQGVQPACRMVETTLGNSQMRLSPQGGLELSQMILRSLFLEHHDNVQDIWHINE